MNDPQRVRTSHIEEYPDGTTISFEYEDLPLPPNDSHVRERQRNVGAGAPSEIITSFAASEQRPATFPPDLPFLAGRDVYTTESPDGSVSTGARWRCTDPDAVVAAGRRGERGGRLDDRSELAPVIDDTGPATRRAPPR